MVVGWNLRWQGTKRKVVNTGGVGLVFECTGWCTLEGSVEGGEWTLGCKVILIGY